MPLDTGGKIRSFQLAKELSRKHHLTLFTFYPDTHTANEELDGLFARVIRVPLQIADRASLVDFLNYLTHMFSGRPHAMTKYCRPEVARRLREHLSQESYDVIICDFLLTAAVIPWQLPCPKIIFTHNVEAVIWRRHYEVSRNPLWKAVSWREFRTMDNMEHLYLKKADHVLTVSGADRETFSSFLNPEKITVIETGVDVEYFRPQAVPEKPHSMVFTGSMDWLPNEDAIFYFVQEILPKVRRHFSDASLTVVGRTPSARLTTLAAKDPNLRITGRVEDIRPYVSESAVYVVPLRIGGGTRIKIFEAMAMGKAVVSTTIGAEGLPVINGHNVILADTAESFADSIVSLFSDAELRSRLGHQARSLVEGNHSWASVAREFDVVFQRLLTKAPRPQSTPESASVTAS